MLMKESFFEKARSLWSQAGPWVICASCRAERRRSLEIGGTVRIQEFQPTIWCVTSTLAQEDLPRDLSILRTIANNHKRCFGAYATVSKPGLVHVEDPVILLKEETSAAASA